MWSKLLRIFLGTLGLILFFVLFMTVSTGIGYLVGTYVPEHYWPYINYGFAIVTGLTFMYAFGTLLLKKDSLFKHKRGKE